jgi:hypothetical protein
MCDEYRQVPRLPATHKAPGKGQREAVVDRVVITDPASAPALVGTGVAVVVAALDAGAVGSAVVALRAGGVEAAGWVGDPSDEGAREMAAELFPNAEVGFVTGG